MNNHLYLLSLLTITLFCIGVSNACRCIQPPPPPKEELANSDIVFIGKVKNIVIDPSYRDAVTFDVYKVYKGTNSPIITVKIGRDSCGFMLNVGTEYIVYGSDIALCGRTSVLNSANEDIRELDSMSTL